MGTYYGYAGSILHVDLTTNEIKTEPLDLDIAHKFIGGLGLNVKLAHDLIKPGVDPLSPENPIIIGAGPLVGTIAPGSARICSITKLPANNAIGWGGGGSVEFGCMMKNSGFDHIIIKGKAKKPVYLKIFDKDIEICDATNLWGKGQGEAVDDLWEKHGRPLGVIATGQAGENQVKFSMAFVDKVATLGRGGLGAVMGSKNLKAIITRGTQTDINIADRKKFRELGKALYERIKKYPARKDAQKYGFLNFMPAIPKEDYLKFKKARVACAGCPIADKEVLEIREGEHKGFIKYTGAMVNVLMPNFYGSGHDYAACIKLTDILDEYGLDMFETFGILKFADDLFEHGRISADELGTEGIDFSDFDALSEWFRKIAFREGFGETLADGFKYFLEIYGEGIEEFAPCVSKGLLAYQSVRGPVPSATFTPFELGMVVHPRGPASAPGGSSPLYFTFNRPIEWIKGHFDRQGIPVDAQERIFTEKEGMAINVGRLTRYAQEYFYACASLGTCGRGQINRFYSNKLQAELYSAATGQEISGSDLMLAMERAFNLEKVMNIKEGFTRKDDAFPEKWFEEPVHMDYYMKVKITKEIAYGLLDDYYRERGWNVEEGRPTKEKLIELGLPDVAADLQEKPTIA